MNTAKSSNGELVRTVKTLVKAGSFIEAMAKILASPPMNGQRRESFRVVLEGVRILKDGGQKDQLLKDLAESSYVVRDLETMGLAVSLISPTGSIESLAERLREAIKDRLTNGESV